MTTGDPLPRVVQQMIDATNAEDSAGFLACFTKDAVVDDWGREFLGESGISGWNDRENIGTHSRISIEDVRAAGQELTLTISVTGDGYNGGGTFVVAVRDELISRLTIRG